MTRSHPEVGRNTAVSVPGPRCATAAMQCLGMGGVLCSGGEGGGSEGGGSEAAAADRGASEGDDFEDLDDYLGPLDGEDGNEGGTAPS